MNAPKTNAQPPAITCLFLDIGGVLLTDGWGRKSRALAADVFNLDPEEMENRHRQAFDAYETGKMNLEEYLDLVVFHQKRPFTRANFRSFMLGQSEANPRMLALIGELKARHGLKIVVVSNEGRELNAHRIRKFKLNGFVDAFISSCFVRLRKPDADIFKLALEVAQVPPERVLYIDNTPMHIEVAKRLGIQSILHTDCQSTCAGLAACGLPCTDEGASHESH